MTRVAHEPAPAPSEESRRATFRGPCRRVRTPTLLQMETSECGAAALGIVLAHHGRHVPLERLRAECGVSRNGVNALNMVRVARGYGLEVDARRREAEQLGDLPLPLVVFWNYNHFLVVEGFSGTHAFLNDPASGRRRVTREEFERCYSGGVFAFTRTDDFQRGGRPRSTWRALATRLRGSRLSLLYVVLAAFALVIPGLVVASFIRIFVDDLMVLQRHRWILWLLAAMLATGAVQSFLTWLKESVLLRLETRLALTWSATFFWHVLHLPIDFYNQRYGGEIATRVALNDSLAALVGGKLAEAVLNVLMIGFYGAVMYFYSPTLTYIAVGLATVNFIVLSALSRYRVDANQRLIQERGKVTGVTMGGLGMIETLQATGRESDFFVRWAGHETRLINVQQEVSASSQVLSVIPGFISNLSGLAVLCVGGLAVMEGNMTLGMLLAFQTLMASFIDPVNSMVGYGANLQEARADLNRLEDVLQNEIEPLPPETEADLPRKLSGRLELREVTFGYSRLEEPLLRDFSLTLAPGHRVAIVGATGSGKSTVARLVTGLVEAWQGEVLLDGRPRGAVPRITRTASVAMVDQDILLFPGTIRENLTLWDDAVGDEAVVSAAKDAAVYDVIVSRPAGLDSTVEEGGRNFSGGERQRLEIARALVTNPSLLVLDEATSALDPLVEKAIDERLRTRGCACLVIAHRLSTVRDADEIIVLDHGRVVQRGRHEVLVARPGPYRRLIEAELTEDPSLGGASGASAGGPA